jgi:hypothetical protein
MTSHHRPHVACFTKPQSSFSCTYIYIYPLSTRFHTPFFSSSPQRKRTQCIVFWPPSASCCCYPRRIVLRLQEEATARAPNSARPCSTILITKRASAQGRLPTTRQPLFALCAVRLLHLVTPTLARLARLARCVALRVRQSAAVTPSAAHSDVTAGHAHVSPTINPARSITL